MWTLPGRSGRTETRRLVGALTGRPLRGQLRTAVWTLFIAAGWSWWTGPLPEDPLPVLEDPRSAPIFRPPSPPGPKIELHRVTAYCTCPLCCGRWSDGFTASGRVAVEGRTAAADPSIWGMGTCLEVPGIGRRVVEDTGSAMIGRRLDIYFESHEEALLFGVQFLPLGKC